MKNRKFNIVTIGGGTGSYMVLSELAKHENINITAIVSMSDSGGSTGILIDQKVGDLPAGDIRQCLVALSETEKILRELFTYRYTNSFLKGHTFGNIFLSTIENISGSFEKSIDIASKILNIKHQILPVTLEKNDLVVELDNDEKIIGEAEIDNNSILNYKKIYLKNNPKINPKIKKKLNEADLIIIAPGNFYCSIIPNFLVENFAKELKKTKTPKYFIANLTTKYNHTDNFSISDFLKELYKISGENDFIDYVIFNKQKKYSNETLEAYRKEGSCPTVFKDGIDYLRCQFIGKKIISEKIYKQKNNDKVKRSLLRHDPKKLINLIFEIHNREKIYIFDFDHTLFNAKKYKKDISKNIFNNKKIISEIIWAEFQNKNKELLDFIKISTDKYLFKEGVEVLKKIKSKKILLSVGYINYQKEKIKRSGVEKYFNQIKIVEKNKIDFLKKICEKNKDKEIIFINDDYNKRYTENLDAKKQLPNIKVVVVDMYKNPRKILNV